MTKRVIAAWFFSVLSLLVFIVSNPLDIIIHGIGPYDILNGFLASIGAGLGLSTWRPTEKSVLGLVGGILGILVGLAYISIIVMAFRFII